MVIVMGHTGLDFVDILPPEVVEEIFQNLSSKDLTNCSLVSIKWREIVNSNRIWAKLCLQESIHDKEPLDTAHSHFHNPMKIFRPVQNSSDRLSNICHWRSHYDRYKFLEQNWRKGHCALHRLNVTNYVCPIYYNDGIMVIVLEKCILVYSITGQIRKLCQVDIEYQNFLVDCVLVSKDLLVYSQSRTVIALKISENKLSELFRINVFDEESISPRFNANDKILTLKRTENFLVVSDIGKPTKLMIWNIDTGKQEKEVDFEKARKNQVAKFNCLEVFSFKAYLAYSIDNSHYICEYNLIKQERGAKFNVPFRVTELYVTREILCAKLSEKRSDDSCDLYMWSLRDMSEVAVIAVNETKPIVLTNDVVLYCTNSTINVQSLQTTFQSKFQVPSEVIINMFAVGNHLLVINTGDCIEVWDWGTGEKLYSPYRGICSSNMWVDERMIVICRWSCNFQIIGYW